MHKKPVFRPLSALAMVIAAGAFLPLAGRTQSQTPAVRPSVEVLLAHIEQLIHHCRGGFGDDPDTQRACRERDLKMKQARALGWCRSDMPPAGKYWRRCSDVPDQGKDGDQGGEASKP